MKENILKTRLKAGESCFGTMLKDSFNINAPELLAMAGFDFFVVDMEHAAYGMQRIYDLLLYARKCDISSVVRIPVLNYSYVAKALDMGAESIWVPHMDTADMARDLVKFAKYPPIGVRGAAVPAYRQKEYAEAPDVPTYYKTLNEQVMLVAQIETREGVKNIEEIMAVDGIDVAMIGTQDLTLDMGLAGQNNHPDVIASVRRVVDACRNNGKIGGNHLQAVEPLRRWMKAGMTMIAYSYEINMMMERGKAVLEELKAPLN